ncbi:hypothetical protein EVAR_57162_1 [Eumeta japonica]|uniref:Uncharacterized protein n=1 Tax=Eumeta variegata TaxID=151549 RepID=A0A4C1YUS9_EUMVA|nr:hypothetical protein EVAR_57162_1 [Eumeta japonica]
MGVAFSYRINTFLRCSGLVSLLIALSLSVSISVLLDSNPDVTLDSDARSALVSDPDLEPDLVPDYLLYRLCNFIRMGFYFICTNFNSTEILYFEKKKKYLSIIKRKLTHQLFLCDLPPGTRKKQKFCYGLSVLPGSLRLAWSKNPLKHNPALPVAASSEWRQARGGANGGKFQLTNSGTKIDSKENAIEAGGARFLRPDRRIRRRYIARRKPIEEWEKFWDDMKDISVKCDENERIVMLVGIQRRRSTIDAGVELVEKNFEVKEDFRNAIGVFCDLFNAFDCVHHETLIRQLHHYGVKGRALDLLASYLTNRVRKFDVINMRSSGTMVRMRVP